MVTGIPLTQTSPASIEKYLVEKVRDDLGDYADMAIIRPMLRIDKEDGDLSGNVTDGFGTIIVKVIDHSFNIPFIIHQKELLPFDVIRMGDEEVAYDMSKLRKLVVQLDRVQRENAEGLENGSLGSIVDYKDAPTHNGFLGTIMSIRDNYQPYDSNGVPLYDGESFGIMDEGRILKFASEQVDVGEVFEEFYEKLANVQRFTVDEVKEVAKRVEERFTKEASEQITEEEIMTKEAVEAERAYNFLKSEILVDANRAASGNNVIFPVFDGTTLEHKKGRVYKQLQSISKNPLKTNVKTVVIDSSGNYAFLKDRDKFMLSNKPVHHFKMNQVRPASMNFKEMYALERDVSTLYSPFIVTGKYTMDEEDAMVVRDIDGISEMKIANSRTFKDALKVTMELGYSRTSRSSFDGDAFIFILKNSNNPFEPISYSELIDLIMRTEDNQDGIRLSRYVIEKVSYFNPAYHKESEIAFYVVGENQEIFFPLKSRIKGHFTRPDGLLTEFNTLTKEAAYNEVNKGRIIAEQNTRPQTYTIEWVYGKETGNGEASEKSLKTHSQNGLTPYQLKGMLSDLGFDERQKAKLMESIKRNGNAIKFNLPSAKLAESMTPLEKGKEKAEEFVKGLANSSLHAGNFVPLLRDVAATGISEGITNAIEPIAVGDNAVGEFIRKRADDSLAVAIELEKVAEDLRGSTWFKVAQLVNMKHQLDKLVFHIQSGFVKEAHELFGIAESLKPEISKVSQELIDFNREQLLKVSSNIVPGGLVKEALAQLDELFGYSLIGEEMEKRANFFNFAAKHKNELKKFDDTIKGLQKEQSSVMNNLRESVIRVRAAERQGLDVKNPQEFERLIQKEREQHEKLSDVTSSLADVARERATIQGEQEMKNRAILTGVGVPLSGALGFTASAMNGEDN